MIDSRIFSTKFACDLQACKGACCTFPGGLGPPVLEEETEILQRAYDLLRAELPKEHTDVVDTFGLFDHHAKGLYLRCYNQRACVFVTYHGKIAKCSIQQAYQDGRFEWMKPISCHLFPVRASGPHRKHLKFEEFSECAPAIERGETSGIALLDFLEEALVRAFGREHYAALKARASEEQATSL